MYEHDPFCPGVRIHYTSNVEYSEGLTTAFRSHTNTMTYSVNTMGGYRYPILDSFLARLNGYYQILKVSRPSSDAEFALLESILRDPSTLYAYPEAGKVTVVQFSNWYNTTDHLADLGVDISCGQKVAKRIKTLNRPFRAYRYDTHPLRVAIIEDTDWTQYADVIDPTDAEKLFDGGFIISAQMKALCLETFREGVSQFTENSNFDIGVFNRNISLSKVYSDAQIFNARVFGDFIDPEGNPIELGAIKGQAYTDQADLCTALGVDFICPRSAFKPEVNTSGFSFTLIEPQNAKLGQMFSDGQTVVNLPSLFNWRDVAHFNKGWFRSAMDSLKSSTVVKSWSELGLSRFDDFTHKMFDTNQIDALISYNVRAWLMCGMKLTDSPWLFRQMARTVLASMQVDNQRKLRFAVPCAVRALVITESLYRLIYNLTPEQYAVDPGVARFDSDMNVLVINDLDYIEMYPSHGGCDLDDFFQIYWRTIGGKKKIVICRSPNDWGEYSMFDYHEGDWYSTSRCYGKQIEFPVIRENSWPQRLSDAIDEGAVTYSGLPDSVQLDPTQDYDADFVLAMVKNTAQSASSVGVNVNARQLYSASAQAHRPVQVCSMESAIDAGVQGGSEEQVSAVIQDGHDMIDELINNKIPIDYYLWESKHAQFSRRNHEVILDTTNVSWLQSVRYNLSDLFKSEAEEYSQSIPHSKDFSLINALGATHLAYACNIIKMIRHSIALSIQTNDGDVDLAPSTHALLKVILTHDDGHSRNSFMLSLWSACLTIPTSQGTYTDQVVMQPEVFPHMLKALQFYGIAAELYVDDRNVLRRKYNDSWEVYDSTLNKKITFDNPVEYQQWGLQPYANAAQNTT